MRDHFGPPLQDFGCRIPVRPFLLIVYLGDTRPGESFTADADPVTQRAAAVLHGIKEVL
jgi:hypothetical protein